MNDNPTDLKDRVIANLARRLCKNCTTCAAPLCAPLSITNEACITRRIRLAEEECLQSPQDAPSTDGEGETHPSTPVYPCPQRNRTCARDAVDPPSKKDCDNCPLGSPIPTLMQSGLQAMDSKVLTQAIDALGPMFLFLAEKIKCPQAVDPTWRQNCPNCYTPGNMRDCVRAWMLSPLFPRPKKGEKS